jgi:hypothetical protein
MIWLKWPRTAPAPLRSPLTLGAAAAIHGGFARPEKKIARLFSKSRATYKKPLIFRLFCL